ncbi:HTTM domain-containing protein [Haliscomenobacter hydrossis]|uniref:Vitamin K-dependent gamma-carboxylase n=1 Tax=Haliscomenobacter hydrossis (strain ATCC 27775 / DSM 1100 / LMG 10767 / O) TaxID=760192 RepID=F4L2U4_HALH1|nr:HTTM domain-containing protein [Haliscomenobacter hydrossis]AEE49624.1 Vitamin K-dependent gamma-carboxylase [Haliscomenobacter hydrossis DSM 1100]
MLGAWLNKPVSIYPLVYARILFGILTFFSTARFMALGWVGDHFIESVVQFKYFGFEWVPLMPPGVMYGIHVLMLLTSLGITLGAFYRWSTVLFFLCFTYVELVDITYYLNHYYFVSLFALLLCFVPAQRYFSIDVWRKATTPCLHIPHWNLFLLRFQVFTVYFFAGIAKINTDWLLQALPLRIWLPAHDDLPLIGFLMPYPLTAYVFSWAGMLFDVSIIAWLLLPRTRLLAYLAIVFFHAVTGMMFQIGIFPLVMIGITPIFFSDGFHEKFVRGIRGVLRLRIPTETQTIASLPGSTKLQRMGFLPLLFVVFQLLFPFRYLLYPGNVFWTEEGYRFSWRVMLMEKAATAQFYVQDRATGREGMVVNQDFLCSHQEKQMAMQPDLILQYAHFLKKHYTKQGLKDPKVRAEVYVTLNGRPSRLYFDPQLDLGRLRDGWRHKDWLYE